MWHALHLGQNCPLCCLGKDFQAIGERLAPEPYAPEIVRTRASWSDNEFANFGQEDVGETIMKLFNALEEADKQVLPPELPAGYWEVLGVPSEQKLLCNRCGDDRRIAIPPSFSVELVLPDETELIDEIL